MTIHILPDVLTTGLRLVFCGTAPSDVSAREGAYYANPSNKFWPTLYTAGFVPQHMHPQQFRQVTQYGIGLTDLVKFAQGVDAVLKHDDFDVAALQQKIQRYQPTMLAFTSKKAASVYFGTTTGRIQYGPQPDHPGPTRFWVLTSPSGAAIRYWDMSYWVALADWFHDRQKQ